MPESLNELRLLARHLVLLAALACGGWAQAQPSGPPAMFSYQPTGTAADLADGVPATFNLAGVSAVPPGGLVNFITPDGRSYLFVFDAYKANRSGGGHWIGHLQGNDGYRALLTWGSAGFGQIGTPDGDFLLETAGSLTRLLDVRRSGRRLQNFGDDAPFAPPPAAPSPQSSAGGPPMAADLPPGFTQIDVLVLYTSSYAARIGPDNIRARIEFLVAAANQAYVDSQANIQLNLVHTAAVSYPYNGISTALADLQNGAVNGLGPMAAVQALRNAYGADLVALVREYDSGIDTSAVGLGYLGGGGGLGAAGMNEQFGFAVVDDGAAINGTGVFSGTYTFAHELGHNMGSAHDRANAGSCATDGAHNNTCGAFHYSYGYGIPSAVGTIMSYIGPSVGRFSNPNISCGNPLQPCGVSGAGNNFTTSADNALSINGTRAAIAGYRVATGLSTTPNAFAFTPLIGANANDNLVSEAIAVGGLTLAGGIASGATAPISITGGQYSINGGAFTAAPGTVANGDSVQLRVTAPATAYATATAYLTIGTLTKAFRATTRAASVTTVPAIAAGQDHALALRADGSLYAWGLNTSGQLGDGANVAQALPEAIALANVTAISARSKSSLVLKSDGTVWVWGDNSNQQFGNGTTSPANSNVPVQIAGLANIQSISMGPFGGLALTDGAHGGAVYAWGFAGEFGGPALPPTTLSPPLTSMAKIAAGNSFGLALDGTGNVWSWGTNTHLQMGKTGPFQGPAQIAGLSGITAIAAGDSHGMALKGNGTVWTWGGNDSGQLGNGASGTDIATPAQVPGLPVIAAIVAGSDSSFAIGADGSLWAWGSNTSGQLGDGTIGTNRLLPVKISLNGVVSVSSYFNFALALLTDGSVWAWGNNFYGQLGNNGATGQSLSPTQVGGGLWYIGTADTEPSAFSFVPAFATPGAPVNSASVTVAGISLGAPISVSGGKYSINGGAFVSSLGTINNGDQVRVQVTAAATPAATKTATLTIGGLSAGFTVTTRSARGDFDGNGKSDVLWMYTTGQTYVWGMNGAGLDLAHTGSPASTGDPGWKVVGIGDFDGDGKSDLLFRHAVTGATTMWMMNGPAIASSGNPGTVADLNWQVKGVGDFNGDGKADILWMHSDGTVQIWFMNGFVATSKPTVAALGPGGSGWVVQGVGDFNGDGKSDILWKNTSGSVVIWMMNGAAIASSPSVTNVGTDSPTAWQVKGVGDFNGDGKADILWRNDDIGGVMYIWIMNGSTITSATNVTGVGTEAATGWIVKSVGDYDGDGRADIFWKNDILPGNQGITYVWLMGPSGTSIGTAASVTGVADTGWQVQNPK